MLMWQDAQIELCMDQGEVSTEQHSTPICELELELKSGDPQQLFELALAILEIVPFELEVVSKAEQGYRLLSGYIEHPVKGISPTLARTDTLADVLKTLIWSCLQHFQNNLRGPFPAEAIRLERIPETVLDRIIGPVSVAIMQVSTSVRRLQHGRLQFYILYVVAGLIALGVLVLLGGVLDR